MQSMRDGGPEKILFTAVMDRIKSLGKHGSNKEFVELVSLAADLCGARYDSKLNLLGKMKGMAEAMRKNSDSNGGGFIPDSAISEIKRRG